jgi:2-amino-4-hydroxy-6-hydroxymethyldihydropteridine diphosphokinase
METCYILFGSNKALRQDSGTSDKNSIFSQACLYINNRCGRVVQVSASYESEPWGFEAEEWFLNRVLVVETALGPENLMKQLLEIEHELGRERHPEKEGYASRTADLDILYYGDRIILTETLTVPHPRLHQRRFALLPMCEVAPNLVHPVFGLTQTELLARCPDTLIVRKIENYQTEEQCITTT